MKKEDAKALIDFISATADAHLALIRHACEAGYTNSCEMINVIYEAHPELSPITQFLAVLTSESHDDEEVEHDGGIVALFDFRAKKMKAQMAQWLKEEFRESDPYAGLQN
jgi:hypothetical protein